MNQKEEFKKAKEFYNNCYETLVKKAHDYAQNNDCFSNFKKIATITEVPLEKVFLIFMTVKIARLVELCKKQTTKVGESAIDSLSDIANYACLMSLYLKEGENNELR